MLVANTLPYAKFISLPDWLRIICSLAAPLFIFLSGYSVHLSRVRAGWAIFTPAISVLLAAIFVDVLAWRIIPLLEFDVLYLISFGLFANALLRNYPRITLAFAVALMVLSPLMIPYDTYRFEIDELSLFDSTVTLTSYFSLNPSQRLFIDGWFPIFPWLSFAFLGSAAAQFKHRILSYRRLIIRISVLFFIVTALHQLNGLLPAMRDGYVETFYPLGYIQMVYSICWIATLFLWLVPKIQSPLMIRMSVLGRKSQLVYISHAFYLGWLIDGNYEPKNITQLIAALALLLLCLIAVSVISEQPTVRTRTSRLPYLLRRMLGLY